ncbi:serine hydrolase domain-containing protein [Streptomyces fungicidicus]|uniref:serine hydrolase domain-containing protein n=1 Tax=Streptomyces fungicidicus TaxID=68203 RepID=UPI0033E5D1E7
MEITKSARWGRSGRWRAGLAVAGAAAIGTASLLGPGTTAEAMGTGGGDARSRLQRDADAVRDTGATGLTVLARDAAGRETQARSGTASLKDGGRVPFDAYYRIGSDTKTFTAVAALQLVGEGTLSLDDTVEQWLPGVVAGNGNDGSRITLRNLLQHTSGLANYTDIAFEDPAELTPERFHAQRFRSQTPEEQVAVAMERAPGWLPDADDPGAETQWAYSNTNYVLLGMVIEKATGNPWAQEVHDRIIEPLGLRRTLIPDTSPYVPMPTAAGYTQFPGRDDLTDTTLAVGGGADGGIISTTRDMNTFLRALLGGRLLPPEQLEQMRTTVPAPGYATDGRTRYGLGLAWRPAEGCEGGIWYHGGTSFGTASETAVTPDGRVSAAAAVFTTRFGDEKRFLDQAEAAVRLLDRAVCGDRKRG